MHYRILLMPNYNKMVAIGGNFSMCELFLDIDLSYECAVNIEELIKLEDVMQEHSLGPNGGEFAILSFLFVLVFSLV